MARAPRLRRLATVLGLAAAAVAVLLTVALAVAESGWGKDRLRSLIISQAESVLDASLQIGRLDGSLVGGVQLSGVRLSRNGVDLVTIDDISLSYSLKALLQRRIVVARIVLTRPHVTIGRTSDGRWDLLALGRREPPAPPSAGAPRPFALPSVRIIDATVALRDPLDFGDVHTPSRYDALNGSLSFTRTAPGWRVAFADVSWRASRPDLTVTRLTGALVSDARGLSFERFSVTTPASAFTVDGVIARTPSPTRLDLRVHAPRFAFEEWGGLVHGLQHIGVTAAFDAGLDGPLDRLDTNIQLESPSGGVRARLVLNTAVPGWHAAGTADLSRLNLAHWLGRPDRPSDITGRTTFDLALELGRAFPRGTYAFDGAHAAFLGYAGDRVSARGTITPSEVLVDALRARAYGADVTASGSSIGLDEPFPFTFRGTASAVDLRRVPSGVPVPHVESRLAFEYDVSGRFSDPAIAGRAAFGPSEFLGAAIAAGTVGSIDTTASPIRFSGDGGVEHLDLRRLGDGLDVGWLRDPRNRGTVTGRFRVQGAGASAAGLTLSGTGHLARAGVFGGTLSDADVSVDIGRGALALSYSGRFSGIDPAVPLADPRARASLNGSGRVRATVRDLLLRSPALADYAIDASASLTSSSVRGVEVASGHVEGTLGNGIAVIDHADVHGATLDAHGAGTLSLDPARASNFQYDFLHADLASLRQTVGGEIGGVATATGRLTGTWRALRLAGTGSIVKLSGAGLRVGAATIDYDATIPSGDVGGATGRVKVEATEVAFARRAVAYVAATIARTNGRLAFGVEARTARRDAALTGTASLDLGARRLELLDATARVGPASWRLARAAPAPAIVWGRGSIAIAPLQFAGGPSGDERLGVSGTWRADGNGALRVSASRVFLETLEGAQNGPAPFGGLLDLEATIRGTADRPVVTGTFTVGDGRIRRLTFQQLSGRVAYEQSRFDVDVRLDQAPGAWLTAAGTVPLSAIDAGAPDGPLDVAIRSSPIDLALVEGVTDAVRSVTGTASLTLRLTGKGRAPHVEGRIAVADAGFIVAATGVHYKNGRATLGLSGDRVAIDACHVEDADGNPLDVVGSLGRREFRAGDVEVHATARHFEVLRNDLGRLAVDATLRLTGGVGQPVLSGEIAVESGELKVDNIMERVVFQPYATTSAQAGGGAAAALNPWTRLGLNIRLRVPDSLRLTGEDLQVSPGTPIGLGSINMRAGGELWLLKDPDAPATVYGSLDSMSGTYAFQGRRFEIQPGSSINFRGDLSPDVYVTVGRTISGVDTRVTIAGSFKSPELRLTSTPPLDPSDILSLIVFNMSINQLSSGQQQELAVRAGTLAAGFLTAPILSALKSATGLDVLEIEPGVGAGAGTRVTIGSQIAPGLVARFSRQFGPDQYNEAVVEYSLSRLLRIRATFSDASSLAVRSPFVRVERAGIDLLLFFSF